MQDEFDPEVFVPLTPIIYQILLSLSRGERHGYAILGEIATRTQNKLRVTTPTLYHSLRRLVADNLIIEIDPPNGDAETDERRRYYRITPHGEQVLDAETERMELTVRVSRQIRPHARPMFGLEGNI